MSLKLPIPNVRKVPRNRRRRRHHRTHQMRPPTAPLPPFEITVAGLKRSALPAAKCPDSSPGTSSIPTRATQIRILKNPVQSFLLCRPFHRLRSWHHHRPHLRADVMPPRHPRRRPQVFNPRIRARSNRTRDRSQYLQSAVPAPAPYTATQAQPPAGPILPTL